MTIYNNEPIKPCVDTALIQAIDHDPFNLMPGDLPDHPRVFFNKAQLERARKNLAEHDWAQAACRLLEENCKAAKQLPDSLPFPVDSELNIKTSNLALRNALAALLTGKTEYRDCALATMRLLADAYNRWSLAKSNLRATNGALAESRFNHSIACAFDLLAAAGLEDSDREKFLAMLASTVAQSDAGEHPFCGNFNTWNLAGRTAVAAARNDRQGIHDALYGCDHGRGWRYGIVHQLRHDILSDGLHWERSLGYHFYTLMAFTEIADAMANIGCDIWRAQLPPLFKSDGNDLHGSYGPDKGTKSLRAAYDAPFYHAFPSGEFSNLHDSGLDHLRGIWIWGIIYNKAWDAYRDRKYSWLLSLMERDYAPSARKYPELPMPLNTHRGDLDFARISEWPIPAGRFSFKRNTKISLSGSHKKACSLFTMHGSAVLRSKPDDPKAAGAFIFWGPHAAGHMGPASLHIDFSARGKRLTDAPHSSGYDDSLHLTWNRTTMAHNTVCIDEASMFPYDFETKSIWECDLWRDRVSDGRLALFQTAAHFSAIRAVNERVYPGVRLDRTIVLTHNFILEVFRAVGETDHTYDWIVHVPGPIRPDPNAVPFNPGEQRGYCHLKEAFSAPFDANGCVLRTDAAAIRILAQPGSSLITARDPVPQKSRLLGALEDIGPRSTIMARTKGREVLFISLWAFDPNLNPDLLLLSGSAKEALTISTSIPDASAKWKIPTDEKPIRMLPINRPTLQ